MVKYKGRENYLNAERKNMNIKIISIPQQNKIKAILTSNEGKKFVGVATCSPDDVFDEAFGNTLAEARAKAKFHKSLMNEAFAEARELFVIKQKAIRNFDKTYEKLHHARKLSLSAQDWVEQLLSSEPFVEGDDDYSI